MKTAFSEFLKETERKMTVDHGSMREPVPSSQSVQRPRANPLDADRIPGYRQSGGSLVGPSSFERRGYFGDDGEPVSPSCIPPGARFDPFAPTPSRSRFPPGVPRPFSPSRPNQPPMSGPDPDHLRVPDYHDLY